MKIATSHSCQPDTLSAVQESCRQLRHRLAQDPDILFVHWSVLYPGEELRKLLADQFPDCRIHGASSCLGGMTEEGVFSQDGRGMVLMGLADPQGAYGVAGGKLGANTRESAADIVLEAINNAGRPGEMPDLVRISSAPGYEDDIITGIETVLGPETPIIGGSAADNQVRGEWELITHRQHLRQGLVITVFYPSTTLSFAFHNGYSPTQAKGRITKGAGRVIEQIDHQPAALVYNDWTGGIISSALENQGSVLADTTLYPLGRVVGEIGGVPYFTLAHPDRVTAGQGLSLFADIKEGDEIILMRGTVETLISRAGRVAQAALQANRLTPEEISGAMVIYCAGCMLTVKDRIDEVSQSLNSALGGKPFLGAFTFGEQGCFPSGENRHANLMISAIVFGPTR
ncbi:FIST signal transduction protein [Desulfurivibrio alkaliphilus]|uniref:FIST C domain protein n=1 Tax=Desulfurivibrio alkaliphilus (strain DSM 19089 / UNIQEM U267 / AHT2) TaxID=589865 RepID=D6Z202_DESAT|nr:FIST N-terminal domain-containing protein [Desulfurivibrio alkaliphilus]ADH85577.1 domain of unknown function DUF1745 [Desulfurivibrio alkaliphilus AHT 2]